MKKLVKFSILLLIVIFISGCDSVSHYLKEVSYRDYEKMIENKETFILEIMSSDCSACKSFKPKLENVLKEYKVEVKYINTDHLSEEEYTLLNNKTGITGTPTVIFYHDGEEKTVASRINGSVSQDKIVSKLKASGFIPE